MKKTLLATIGLAAFCFLATNSQAELSQFSGTAVVNGIEYQNVQVIYDDCLDIAYMDFASGKLIWGEAHDFILSLSWISADGVVYDSWRLPSLGDWQSEGYIYPDSELGHLYYDELGNISLAEARDCGDEFANEEECLAGLVNIGPFTSLSEENPYWFGEDEAASYDTYAPYFDFATGYQGEIAKSAPLYVLPVRDGGIAAEGTTPVHLPRKPSTSGYKGDNYATSDSKSK
ncbi:MAG: hypothetical protein KKA54_21085 [Proteobacteria bacterium]|nr:hypothetical protein [Pseudomonadota bacterium]MBU0968861.1 hypothetical protein [Pseudomonadota bacterium]